MTNSPLVVYRYKLPRQITDDETPIRTIMAPDHVGAAAVVVRELERMGEPVAAEIEGSLRRLGSW